MNAENVLLALFAGLCGGCLGFGAAWRFGLKLERHGLTLRAWSQPWDLGAFIRQGAETAERVVAMRGQR